MLFDFLKKRRIEKAKSEFIKGKITLYDFMDSLSGYAGNKIDFSFGGFGETRAIKPINLYSVQARSHQLYQENPYAASIINRIVTKTVNNGFRLRSTPVKKVLNFLPDSYFKEFSEKTESLFSLWSQSPELICFHKQRNFAEMQSVAMKSSLIHGDCLCIQYLDSKTGLPKYELIDGCDIRTPEGGIDNVFDGVKYSPKGEPEAFYVWRYSSKKMTWEVNEVSAKDKTGRLRAWLIKSGYSNIKTRRGNPLLGVVLQNLNDVGRYMDSEQRAALVNSIVAVVHQKDPSLPDAVDRFKNAGISHTVEENDPNGTTKEFEFKKMKPGFFATNLDAGETIKSFDTSRPNVNFGTFTDVVTKPMFYVHGIPPEVLKMEYNSNYSASRAAIIDFENRTREINSVFNKSFSSKVYKAWLEGMILTGQIEAKGYIAAMSDPYEWAVKAAYQSHVWRGLPKMNIDGFKQAKENEIAVSMGLKTRSQLADEFYDTDFETNADDLEKEAERIKKIKEIEGVEDALTGN